MKESIGYTVSLNIIITFIVIIITFLCSALIYFKSNKVSNIITETIEKYEGYNDVAISEITKKLSSLGYNAKKITCADTVDSSYVNNVTCPLISNGPGDGRNGYCIYLCNEQELEYDLNKDGVVDKEDGNYLLYHSLLPEEYPVNLSEQAKDINNDGVFTSDDAAGLINGSFKGDVTYYYYYKIKTNMMLNIPIINDMLDIPIFSNTNRLYDFEENLN